jgi:hypothetical protein
MDRTDEIRGVLLDILTEGLLRIRRLGNSGNADACSLEADHLHNLPELIRSVHRRELLCFYYNVERPAFERASTFSVERFKALWARLGPLIGADSI